jgi:hypothetical protein
MQFLPGPFDRWCLVPGFADTNPLRRDSNVFLQIGNENLDSFVLWCIIEWKEIGLYHDRWLKVLFW